MAKSEHFKHHCNHLVINNLQSHIVKGA